MSAIFQSWQNQNRYRTYPFRDDAVLSPDTDPDISLPNSFIVDFAMSLPIQDVFGVVQASVTDVKLSAMMYGEPMLSLFFSDADGNNLASVSIPDLTEHVAGMTYPVSGIGVYDDIHGHIVLGDLEELRESFPPGTYKFSNALLEAATIRPVLRGVRSIRAGMGASETNPLYGRVKLIEGSNVKLTVIPEQNAIRIDAVNTSGFSEDCDCEDAEKSSEIKTINGISAKDLKIKAGECVKIEENKAGSLVISDTCSKPCCGCEELDFITDRLGYLETAVSKVESFAETLNSVVPASLLSAKLAIASYGTLDESDPIVT